MLSANKLFSEMRRMVFIRFTHIQSFIESEQGPIWIVIPINIYYRFKVCNAICLMYLELFLIYFRLSISINQHNVIMPCLGINTSEQPWVFAITHVNVHENMSTFDKIIKKDDRYVVYSSKDCNNIISQQKNIHKE